MKKQRLFSFALFVGCFLPVLAYGAPAITVSASAVSILGTSQTISISVSLIDPNATGMLRVSGTGIVPIMKASTVTPGSTATVGPIYGNDVIIDGFGNLNGTYYKVQVFTVTGGIIASTPSLQNFYQFTGSGTIDLSTATPLVPSFMSNASGSVSLPGNFSVTGTSTLTGNTTVGGTLGVTGALTFGNSKVLGYDITQNGLVGDGATDNTAALNSLVTTACASGIRNLLVPTGNFIFNSKPNTIPCGIYFVAPYSLGVGIGFGSYFTINYNEATPKNGFLWWTGANASTEGNGGGMIGVNILVNTGKTAGTLVKADAAGGCTNRAADMQFVNGKYGGGGGGNESYAFYIDGSGCTGAGTQGVRDIFIGPGVETFNSSVEAIHTDNCAHCFLHGVITSPGTGVGDVNITGQGSGTAASTDIGIAASSLNGNLKLDFATNVNVSAFVSGTLSSTANTTLSHFTGIATTYSPTSGLSIVAYDQSAAAGQNGTVVNMLRATNAVAAGSIPSSIVTTGWLSSSAGLIAMGTASNADFLAADAGQVHGLFAYRTDAANPAFALGTADSTHCRLKGNGVQWLFRRGDDGADCPITTQAASITGGSYLTNANCAAVGSAANPSVAACGAAPAGAFSCATNASGGTCQVNTTAVTANSNIIVQQVSYTGSRLSVTCNTSSVLPAGPLTTTISAGASFTIALGTVTTNPGCFVYWITD